MSRSCKPRENSIVSRLLGLAPLPRTAGALGAASCGVLLGGALVWAAPEKLNPNNLPSRGQMLENKLPHSPAATAATASTLAPVNLPQAVSEDVVPLPKGYKLTWGQEPVENVSSTRAQICLNGLWKFAPAVAENAENPKAGWGFIAVPGSWGGVRSYKLPGVVAKGKGPGFAPAQGSTDDPLKALGKAWYERPLNIPANWRGRRIVLDFARLSTDARVWINDQEIGRVEFPYGQVDISRAVTPGTPATLRMLVAAAGGGEVEQVFMGTTDAQVNTVKTELDVKGIVGDVLLQSEPAGPRVSSVFVQPSTRKKQLALDIELEGVTQAGSVRVIANAFDENGKLKKTFSSSARVAAGSPIVKMAWPWPNPRLWDFGKPNQYNLKVSVQGAGVNDEYAQEFGFREFWIDGRRFMLNGTEVRLRPGVLGNEANSDFSTREEVDGVINGLRYTGFNIQEFWPQDRFKRGSNYQDELFFDRADEKGWGIIGALPSMAGLADPAKWNDPAQRGAWELKLQNELRRYRNHPSVVMWVHSANRFGNWQDQNPRVAGNTAALKAVNDQSNARAMIGVEANEIIKHLDPTRAVTTHSGGFAGDFQTVNNYLNFIPFQEQEEWLSEWAQTGTVPYMPVEFGFILGCDLRRGRNTGGWGKWGATMTEDLGAEFLAMFYGRRAYEEESKAHREYHVTRYLPDEAKIDSINQDAGRKAKYKEALKGNPRQVYMEWEIIDPLAREMEAAVALRNYRSWRTMGTTAGMIPWEYAFVSGNSKEQVAVGPFVPGRRGAYRPFVSAGKFYYAQPQGGLGGKQLLSEALRRANSETLAWICGPDVQGDIAAFTAKDHSFTSGSRVQKRVALLNDSRDPQSYTVTTRAMLDGKTLHSETRTGRLAVSQTAFVPFEFQVPQVASKTNGTIEMTATIGEASHTDSFAFRAFAPVVPARQNVAVFDPKGQTTAMLRRLGYNPLPWNGQPSAQLLIVGREALSKNHTPPGDLQAFAQGGGRVLMMEQHPDWLRKMGFRVGVQVRRELFAVNATHPVMAGLDADDLRDWAGHSTLVEAKPISTDADKSSYGYPVHGWKWGNRGGVSSAMIEKPHRSSWRPILEGDFDLAYSPLMEMDFGRGRVLLCTLDLEDHAALDAGAAQLGANVLSYARTMPLPGKARVTLLLASDKWASRLADMGVAFGLTDSVPAQVQAGDLLLVEPGRASASDLERFARAGSRVLVLPSREAGADAGLTREAGADARLTLAKADNFIGSLQVPSWDVVTGLSPSDLRLRSPFAATVLQAAPGVEVSANGLLARRALGSGEIVWCQLDPEALPADTLTYFRFSRWRQTRAMSQLLSNMGARFVADERIFKPDTRITRLSLAGEWKAKLTIPLPQTAAGVTDPRMSGEAKAAVSPGFDDANYETRNVPGAWESWGGAWAAKDGEAVFRRVVDIPAQWNSKELVLTLGPVDDFDATYWNGEKIGETGGSETSFSVQRRYTIPASKVKPGRNVLAIRVFDRLGDGGFLGSVNDLALRPTSMMNGQGGLYHPDYRTDFPLGDDPHRYYRW